MFTKERLLNLFRPNKKRLFYLILSLCALFVLLSTFVVFGGIRIPVAVKVSPTDAVSQHTNFTFTFSSRVAEDAKIGVFHDEEKSIIFSPKIAGKFKWLSNKELQFYPYEPLKGGRKYKVEVKDKICEVENKYLTGRKIFSFYTAPLTILRSSSTTIYSGEIHPIKKRIEWSIEFNYKVKPEEFKKHTSMFICQRPFSKALSFEIQPAGGEPRVNFKIITGPIEITEEDRQEVVLKITKGLKPADEELGLEVDFVDSSTIRSKLTIDEVYGRSRNYSSWIVIRFSSKVCLRLAQEYIKIAPEVKFTIEQHWDDLELKGDFKPGQNYEVTILKGLIAVDGTYFSKTFTQNVRIPNFEPSIEFEHKGRYLLRKGELNLGIKSMNVEKTLIEVKRIFTNNIVHFLHTSPREFDVYEYYHDYGSDYLSKKIYSEEVKIEGEKNKIIKTTFNMERFIGEKRKGVFNVVIRDTEEMWRSDGVAVVITDLGIIAKKSTQELFVWVNSLKNLTPVSEVKIKLLSRDNQLLAEGITNDDGVCIIKGLKEKIEDFVPFVIVAEKGDDFSFLRFPDCAIPIHYFDIGGGEYLAEDYQAFLYTDRGVYRPNDVAHIVGVVREKGLRALKSLPVILKIFDPQNKTFKEFKGELNPEGAVEFEVNIPEYATTGRYIGRLLIAENEIGSVSFLVEEFIPDRIKVKVETDKKEYNTGETVKVNVEGVYLFGPPASNKRTRGFCRIRGWSFTPKNLSMYTFGDADKSFGEITIDFEERHLDEEGKLTYEFKIPENIRPPSTLQGNIQVEVIEEGGRAVTAYHIINIFPYPYYIGLKPKTPGYAEIGEEYECDYIVVDKNGKEVTPKLLKVSFYRIIWESILKKDEKGYWRWTSEKNEQLINSFNITPGKEIKYTPKDYGEYKIVVEEPESNSSSSLCFYASGWGYAPWSLSAPDRIKITLDKEDYRPGGVAVLHIEAPFAGKLLLTLETDRVLLCKTYELAENTASIALPVEADYSPNAYIYATVIRKLVPDEEVMPTRAFGIVPLKVSAEDKRLEVKIISEDVIRPNRELELKVSANKPNTYLTVMAVDEGICQLTNFKAPDIFDFFYGKKRLAVSSYDIYSFILPEIKKPIKPGGDIPRKHLIPLSVKRVEPVSLWSGIVKTDGEGEADVKFRVPQFQGSLRVMVVAFKGDCVNSTEKFIKVRDPIVLTPTFPRFLGGNDKIIIPVRVFNGTKKDGEIKVTLTGNSLVEISEPTKTILVKKGREEYVYFDLKAKEGMGKINIKVSATGLNESTYEEVELPLRPVSPVITLADSGCITPGKSAMIELPGGWIEGTQHCKIIFSAFPEVKLSGSLQYLLKYPHSCIEPTTSRVFPLLYFNELAQRLEPELFKKNSAEYYIMEGIEKLQRMQQPNGGFSFWLGSLDVNPWGSIYASHFLIEAKKAGYPVRKDVQKGIVKYLTELVNEPSSDSWRLEQKAYACYVLALAQEPNKSGMLFLKAYKLKDLSFFSRFQLAGAFAHSGDINTAKSILPTEIHPQKDKVRETGGNFYSSVRENAIMLDILIEVLPESPAIPILVNALFSATDEKLGRWYTTQENAFALLALGKAFKKFEKAEFSGVITVGNKAYKKFTEAGLTIEDKGLIDKKINVQIEGKGNCYYYWQAYGIKKGETYPEFEKGIEISRIYLDRNGKEIGLDRLRQGDIIVAKISAKAQQKHLDNVIICDMLPAGLEIENPRLESRATIPWVEEQSKPYYMDIRDDRMLLYTPLNFRDWSIFYYTLRVVNQGEFALPPVLAECMYDPNYVAVKSSGRVKVVK